MVSPSVNKILREAQALSDIERKELLRSLLEEIEILLGPLGQRELTRQEQVREALVQRGLLEVKPPRGKDPDRYRRWRPIPIKGGPLSETVIEERR